MAAWILQGLLRPSPGPGHLAPYCPLALIFLTEGWAKAKANKNKHPHCRWDVTVNPCDLWTHGNPLKYEADGFTSGD